MNQLHYFSALKWLLQPWCLGGLAGFATIQINGGAWWLLLIPGAILFIYALVRLSEWLDARHWRQAHEETVLSFLREGKRVQTPVSGKKQAVMAERAGSAFPLSGWGGAKKRPKIICLSGSSKFAEQFAIKSWELERQGNIVLCGCILLPAWYCGGVEHHFAEHTGCAAQCDELHLRKIDLADELLVLNVGGYIGESTRKEIAYARAIGKPVSFMETVLISKGGSI